MRDMDPLAAEPGFQIPRFACKRSRPGVGKLLGAVAFRLWDFAVNAGISQAVINLHRAVGVADDGKGWARRVAGNLRYAAADA